MILGLLPAWGGGLVDLKRSGQHRRLLDGYLRRYLRTFDRIYYFSYANEQLQHYTDCPELQARVQVIANRWRLPARLYAFLLPALAGPYLRRCQVLRVFQLTGVVPALLSKLLFGTPFAVTYGYWYSQLARHPLKRGMLRLLERVGLGYADAVIVTTRQVERLVQPHVHRGSIHLIPNGVEVDRFAPRQGEVKQNRILFVGRLEPEKNLLRLIEALGRLAAKEDVQLELIGSGSQQEALLARAVAVGVKVHHLGTIDHYDLPHHYNQAKLFVLPSLTEGHPKVLLEAMSCGLCCIASDCPGNRSLIEDGVTGLLFDPYDVTHMARQIGRALHHPELVHHLGEKARALILQHYHLDQLLGREVELLAGLAARVGRG